MNDSVRRRNLIERATQGDLDAMGTLLAHFRPYLSVLARRHLDSAVNARIDPSDVVQQTCLEAYRDVNAFRGECEAEFAAWLNRILTHNLQQTFQAHCVAQKRTVSREQAAPHLDGDAGGFAGHLAAGDSSPSRRLMRGELAVRVAREIEQLPTDQREAVRLRHLEGWSLAQLASHFERSDAAVAGLIKRGLRALRQRLSDVSEE